MKKLLSFLLFGMLFAQAQIFDCDTLLKQSLPAQPPQLSSVEANMVITTFETSEETSETTMYQVIDIAGRRLYTEMTFPDDDLGMIRYQNGQGTMTMTVQGETTTEVLPDEASAQLEQLFDNVFAQQTVLPKNYEVLSCDGVQSYGGLIEGEQITVRGDVPNLGELVMRIVIDEKSERIGVVSNLPETGNTLVIVQGFKFNSPAIPETIQIDMYKLEANVATPFSKVQIAYLKLDEPIDETLFGGGAECEGLLEGLAKQNDFSSLELKDTLEASQMTDYIVIDFLQHRIYWETNNGYWKTTDDGKPTIYRLVNGEVTGAIKVNGKEELTSVPEQVRDYLPTWFTTPVMFFVNIDKNVLPLSCDGNKSYSDESGELVRGKQLSIQLKQATEYMGDNVALLFDEAGDFIGIYQEYFNNDWTSLAIRSSVVKDEAGVVIKDTLTFYLQEDDVFELESKSTREILSYNKPVDESLFPAQ